MEVGALASKHMQELGINQEFSNILHGSDHKTFHVLKLSGGLIKPQITNFWVQPPVFPAWGPRVCDSNMFLGDADAAGLGTTH